MPSIVQTPKGTRCIRCATIIRNSRKNCPSCDLDFEASNSVPAQSSANAYSNGNGNGHSKSKIASRVGSRVGPAASSPKNSSESGRAKARAARADMKLCPVCMSSVSESEMSEVKGQLVCNNCAVSLKNKASRPPAAAGVVAPARVSSPSISSASHEAAPAPRPVSASGRPAMSDDELLTAKGMQRQLMSKLTWIKVLVIIWGVLNIIGGGIIYAAGAVGGAVVDVMDDKAFDRMMKNRKDEEGNPISASEIEERRQDFMERRDKMSKEIFKVKVLASLALFAGVSFIAAFFMMNQKPYEVCIIVTVLYVLCKVLGLILGGAPGMIDIFVTLSVLGTLTTGISTGMRIKDIRERAEAATGRPMVA